MHVVLIHKETGRFVTPPGLCRGWSNYLGNAQLFPDLESAKAFVTPDVWKGVKPAYVYLFDEPLPLPEGAEWE